MAEKVELILRHEKSKEQPNELIIRYFSALSQGNNEDYEIYPEGRDIPEKLMDKYSLRDDKKVYGIYKKALYLTKKHLLITRPGGGWHILAYHEINGDRDFFRRWGYIEPGHIWELLDTLISKMIKNFKFSGPPQLRRFVYNLDDLTRKEFGIEVYPQGWQAGIVCKCKCKSFAIRYSGEILPDGSLSDTTDNIQRIELVCKDCGQNILLFDPLIHGYNAVIARCMPEYTEDRKTLKELLCQCDNKFFELAVMAMYDIDPTISSNRKNDSYGWFHAFSRCETCGAVREFIDYECA